MVTGALNGCNVSEADNETVANSSKELQTSQSLQLSVEPTCENYVKLAEELRTAHQQNPDDTETALAYAEKLIQLGDVDEAREVLSSVTAANPSNPQATYLTTQNDYLCGKYEKAEAGFTKLYQEYPEYQEKAGTGLTMVYYQTNQYQKAQALPKEHTGGADVYNMMKAYGKAEPYRVSWTNGQSSVIPFLYTNPLPMVELEINGVKKISLLIPVQVKRT